MKAAVGEGGDLRPQYPMIYWIMARITDKSLVSPDAPESQDPGYLAWVDAKIEQGRRDMKDPAKRLSERQVWYALGLED